MKASPTILCNNILFRAKKDKIPVTPMKLQKLMYFVCKEYTKKMNTSPISESFEVWQYGPVLPSVYSEFKTFGANAITEYAKDANGNSYVVSEEDNPTLRQIINNVWENYGIKTGIELSRITHQQKSGWYAAFCENRSYITEEDMKNDKTV